MLLPTEYAASSFLRLVSGIMYKFLHKVFFASGSSLKPVLNLFLEKKKFFGVIILLFNLLLFD